jgi:exodeoxyribonuclease-3
VGLRLVTLNLNGIRSAASKGFLEWAEKTGADCMCVQEVKAQAADLTGRFERIGALKGHFHYAWKRGYSGVGVYACKKPTEVIVGLRDREFGTRGGMSKPASTTLGGASASSVATSPAGAPASTASRPTTGISK